MSWIDILWPVMGASSFTLGVLHAMIWMRERSQVAYLAFSIAAAAVAAMAIFELLLMRTTSVVVFNGLVRWAMVTMTVLLAALVVFVRLYFRAGSWYLALAACLGHALCLLPNFLTGVNLIFLSVDWLEPLRAWDGTTISVPHGTPNPWMLAWYAADLLMIGFWITAIREVQMRGEQHEMRRRAWLTCGALILFVVGGAGCAVLVANGWLRAPFMVNVPFVGVVLMISYTLAGDVFRAARLARDLARNELRLLESEQQLLRHERDQAVLREELAHLSRVAVMSEISGSLAHELNQPLTAVLSNAQAALRYLARDPPDLASMHECLLEVVESDKRAGEVIRRLRSMLRKEPARFQVLDINEVVAEVVGLMRSDLLSRDATVQLNLDRDLPRIQGDRIQLQQVVLNLIVNACDAMTSVATERVVVLETSRAAASNIEVRVRDCGIGIPHADLEEIFRPFVTSKPDGMGLGLTVCRSLIEAHFGRLWASHNEPRGTCLHFTVPAFLEPIAASESSSSQLRTVTRESDLPDEPNALSTAPHPVG